MATAVLFSAVDALLPQTQCTRCGHPDCAAYARAIADEGAAINRCPPGGEALIAALAALTGRAPLPPDPDCGGQQPLAVALVDESLCIGCTICIQACPVDAILGAPKRMHTVVDALCSGCGLCVAPCPVGCIEMRPAGRTWGERDSDAARRRHAERARRLERGERVSDRLSAAVADDARARDLRRASVAAAFERARERRARPVPPR
ncbi:MAG: RnfABCDGE type electron transport complex subunit B [Burkholderiales bacterium]|nr:RnfABCDGE type electron transport complex subunit B [Burkholderiales bacterium]